MNANLSSAMDEAAIRLERVTKAFDGHTVLDEVSFRVPKGTAFCLLGKSGAGKSVTLKLLIGLLQPDAGDVVVRGRSVPGLSPPDLSELRHRMGFLFQHAALFDSISLGENVAFGLRRGESLGEGEVRQRAERRLEQVGLGGQYDKMPAALSGGMRKRAGLARALAMDPEVLLVDEPSAGLDPITSAEIDELLLGLKSDGKTTMVIVTHNMPSARRVGDRFALLENGRIQAEGAVGDFESSEDPIVRRFVSADTGG
jgi:phospholipid/cholesterol/gamma-HCH transport system ATP-binding protein